MINLALVEDNRSYASTLQKILNQETDIHCQKIYSNSSSAWNDEQTMSELNVLLLDIQLPDYSGIELLSKLKDKFPNIIYLILTVYEDEEKLFNSLKAGANGYILKSESPSIIMENIRSAVNGNAPMSTNIARKVVEFFHEGREKNKKLSELSPKENEILNLLSKGNLYKEIAEILNISLDTVKKHCGNIYRKLHVCNRTEALNIYFNS